MSEAESLLAKIILTDCQKRSIDAVLNDRSHITISGPAGSGKSFLTKILIKKLIEKNNGGVILSAPTHQAKIVLSKMSGYTASTIHSIMKIHPDTYEDVREFKQSKSDKAKKDLNEVRYLIVDEASMVDNDLFEIILKSVHPYCQIIGIGDKHQIQPVRHAPGEISPFFTDKRFRLSEMNTIVRQQAGNPIIQVATKIRQGGWFETNWDKETGTGVLDVKNIANLMKVYLSKVKTPEDLLNYRMLAYTNEVVNSFNRVIRKQVYQTTEPFIDSEYLVMQEPVIRETDVGGETFTETLLNNGETVKIIPGSIKRESRYINLPMVDPVQIEVATMMVERTEVDLTDDVDAETEVEISVVWDANSQVQLDEALSYAASQYKAMGKGKATTRYWEIFWEVKNMFTNTKSLGASTFHKSQGTTVIGVCVYTGDMNFAQFEIQTQLGYVGCTRAQKWVMYC
ncbi:Dda DNA helicase [Aeromonas phage phiAS5]|uniref:Dda DNA helicase n=1 Tax=Aeromonas phage phiAS5 TaxID=879630 RepID=E1A2E0_9CAUD|nr:Dda-like helicase [Aeromonas phage phiAS5]ADM79886.1 Dda DNA helicase [Aeromonas phage phiAS5]BES53345.1 AAA family ATPase [Aeromonas phage phiWae14]